MSNNDDLFEAAGSVLGCILCPVIYLIASSLPLVIAFFIIRFLIKLFS